MPKKKKKPQEFLTWTLCSARGQRGLTLVVGITEAALTYFRSGRQELDAPVLTMTMEQARSVASVALFYGKDRTTLERIITDQGWLVEDYDEDDEEEDDEDEDVS